MRELRLITCSLHLCANMLTKLQINDDYRNAIIQYDVKVV